MEDTKMTTIADSLEGQPRPTPRQNMIARFKMHRGFQFGLFVLLVIFAMAIFAPLLAPYDPYLQDLSSRLIDPVWNEKGTWAHPFGTDGLGRDYLSRMIYGSRIALIIGFSTVLISGTIGTILGVTAGYFGGRVDMVISFLILNRLSLPLVLIALAVVASLGNSLFIVIMALGFLLWDRFAVVMRSATMQIRNMEYIAAAQVLGASTPRILAKDIFPNVLNQLVVVATLEMAHAILLEASMSFLGLGVQPPLPSWGLMVSEASKFMFFKAWMVTIPGSAIFILVFAINLLGDGVRDIAAPESRN
ncbi:ABC transporter permease [Profundibacter amoris]|uniref:ABC transporter permease n=2 Tax=Profundibacter amoris TaxID=2171755 RepID=A0A347UFT3_9RHOB|nr:ABC transporter permease [Profundibacter amoris]AXX97711.1 ABC transporter permease [Profundibacter amoris]